MRLSGQVGYLGVMVLLAGCAAPAPQPFQAMKPGTQLSYGYKDTRIDASHYNIIYAGDSRAAAETFMVQRAAQVARLAGYSYFVFDQRGVQTILRSDNDLIAPERVAGRPDQGANNVNDYVPDVRRTNVATFYYAWGQMVLLSPSQAQANPAALQVTAVLEHPQAGP
jgi:hypothetical protein